MYHKNSVRNIMKLIHTSDWHIGQQLYGYDRTEDHRHFFRQLTDICTQEQPDALLVSGDIFDVSSPSAACMRMFTDFILELHQKVPGMKIIITSGNHDSASRIDVNRNLWRAAGIYVIGTVRRENGVYDFSDNVIEIDGKGMVLAVPYINPAFMGSREDANDVERQFFRAGAECVKARNMPDLPAVLMAHMTVVGCDRRGHRETQIGKIEAVKSDVFPEYFEYVALGHIHKPQSLVEDGRIRYSGTPVAVSFDEDYAHSVSIVEIEHGSSPKIHEVEIFQNRELLTFPIEAVDFKTARMKLSKFPKDENCFIRLNVSQEAALPSDCEEQATMATDGKQCKYCTIRYEYTGAIKKEALDALSLSEFADLTTRELAKRFFGSKGIPEATAAEYLQMLNDIEDELNMAKSE